MCSRYLSRPDALGRVGPILALWSRRRGRAESTAPRGDEMTMRIATLLTAAAVAWLGTTVLASTVTYDYDRTANFSKFRTYSWTRGNPVKDELNHQRIMGAIDAQLAMHGFTRAGTGQNPDVLVAYHAAFDESVQINAFGSGGWGPY